MKTTTIETKVLQKAMAAVRRVAPTKSTMEVLKCVLVEKLPGDQLRLTASDLDVVATHQCESTGGEFAVCVEAKKLGDVVDTLTEEQTTITVDDTGNMLVKSGAAKFKMPTLSAADFPAAPKADGGKTGTMDPAVLLSALQSVTYAASEDETRYVLNGANLACKDGRLTFSTTDGHRLHRTSVLANGVSDVFAASCVVPTKALAEIARLSKEAGDTPVKLTLSASHVSAEVGGTKITAKLIDGKFPDLSAVIPKASTIKFVAPRDLLAGAVRSASLLAEDRQASVVLDVTTGDGVRLYAESANGAAEQSVLAEATGDIKMRVNASYIKDALAHVSGESVTVEFTDPLSPVVVTGANRDSLAVVMPMRM